ncbi:MAG: membrane dipeptidase [Alphaproteobacteria bacterium]|nr:membrane dipeptidase [Alphaproteobacteria bacterium]
MTPPTLLRDALVYDAHSGFWPRAEMDLSVLARWADAGVSFLSVNVGFDVVPFPGAVRNLAAFRGFIQSNPDRYILVERAADIRAAKAAGKLGIAFDIEGMEVLGGQVEMIDVYYRLGVRQALFAYNLNNAAAGGCHDEDHGLTTYGRAILAAMNRVGMLVDCCHVGRRTSLDLITLSAAPVVFSHCVPTAIAEHPRNVDAEQMRACAATGGVIGITGVGRFLGDAAARPETFVRAVDVAVQTVGAAHVGLGLDYTWETSASAGGMRFWPPEHYQGSFTFLPPERLGDITEGLLHLGYAEADVRAILGGNFMRVAEAVWG